MMFESKVKYEYIVVNFSGHFTKKLISLNIYLITYTNKQINTQHAQLVRYQTFSHMMQ
jgi:hypothetical protein